MIVELRCTLLHSIIRNIPFVQIKEEQLDCHVGVDSKNECDSTRNGDAVHSGDEDSNHRCEVIETKPVSLNSGHGAGGGGQEKTGCLRSW